MKIASVNPGMAFHMDGDDFTVVKIEGGQVYFNNTRSNILLNMLSTRNYIVLLTNAICLNNNTK